MPKNAHSIRHHYAPAVALLLGVLLFALGTQRVFAISPIHVTSNGSGGGGSWGDPTSLQGALSTATAGDEIWVATGVYTPGISASDTFTLKAGVAIYGGFTATETVRSQRDWLTNVTVLSGDIDNNDLGKDAHGVVMDTANLTGTNSTTVVSANSGSAPMTTTTALDGFTITAGNAVSWTGGGFSCFGANNHVCSPHLENIIFSANMANVGGAMYNNSQNGDSSPSLVNVTFTHNTAVGTSRGGAIANIGVFGGISSPSLITVTFTNNSAVGNPTDGGKGGAIYNEGSSGGISNPSLVNVTFNFNSATGEDTTSGEGGAMYNNGESRPSLVNVTFFHNNASGSGARGGAIYNFGETGDSSPSLVNVTFEFNMATGDDTAGGKGGAMYNNGQFGESSPSLVNVTFINNGAIGAFSEGGAMYNNGLFGTNHVTLKQVTFSGNGIDGSDAAGGAIFNALGSGVNSVPDLEDVIFTGNAIGHGFGGALANSYDAGSTPPRMVNLLFYNNSAVNGGALYNSAPPNSEITSTLQNGTFANNNAAQNGGAIYSQQINVRLVNTILAGNSIGVHGPGGHGSQIYNDSGSVELATSLVQAALNSDALFSINGGSITDSGGSLFMSPLFVDGAPGGSDFRLQSGSPAIDTGTNSAITVTTDLDGNPRKVDGDGDGSAVVDMGAYEAAAFPTHTVTLTLAGSGSGQVGSTPARTPCAASCTLTYPQGASVTLNVTPTTGSTFNGWIGAGCSGTSACTLTMNNNKNVTATFTKNSVALTITTVGSGSVTPNQPTYLYGTVVTLTATAAIGFTFSGWSGAGCSGADTCSVTMTSPQNVTATFTKNSYALTITTAGSGTVSKSPDQATYTHGTVVTLTPDAADGFTFTGWSGAGCSGTGPCSVTMTSAKSVSATFTKDDTPGNDAPNFTSTPALTATVGVSYTYAVIALDPNTGDTLTLSAPVKPAWLTLTPTSNGVATFSGTPGSADVGANPVQLRVQDGAGAFDTQSFTITVAAAAAPTTTGSIQGTVVDGDGKGIEGATVTLTTANSQAAVAAVLTQVTDSNGGYLFEGVPSGDYMLTATMDGKAPSLPLAVSVQEGQTATVPAIVLSDSSQPTTSSVHMPFLGK